MTNTVWIYVDPLAGLDEDSGNHLKVFATKEAADKWFAQNDPEGVAFEHEVLQ